VGAFGETGRGTEEVTRGRADVLVGTLGKAMGVNGGYVCSDEAVIRYLREKNPMYIYSNPISPGEAAAALTSLELIRNGAALLAHLREMTGRFRSGLKKLGFETIDGQHPVVPLLVRDTDRTRALVQHLRDGGRLSADGERIEIPTASASAKASWRRSGNQPNLRPTSKPVCGVVRSSAKPRALR